MKYFLYSECHFSCVGSKVHALLAAQPREFAITMETIMEAR